MDLAVFRAMNDPLPAMRALWEPFAHPWAPAVLGVAVLLAAVRWRRWAAVALALAAVAVTDPLCSFALKPAFDRIRPCAALADVQLVEAAPCGSGRALPSNHAANTAALAAALRSPPLAAVSVAVGASRVALGQHWPSDVLAGWGIGAAIGLSLRAAARRLLGSGGGHGWS